MTDATRSPVWMPRSLFEGFCLAIAVGFTVFFGALVLPPALASGDIPGAFAAGFVNPFAAGYATDVLLCWLALAGWIVRDRQVHGLRGGWACALLGVVPGVAVGFSLYLILRARQLEGPRTDAQRR